MDGGAAAVVAEFEPSFVCLDNIVQNFIEDNNEKQYAAVAKCTRNRCNCFHGNNNSSNDEFDFFSDGLSANSSFSNPCDTLKFGTEGVSSIGRAGLATSGVDAVKKSLPSAARIMRSSSPYRIGHAGSLSTSVEEFSMYGSPNRVTIRASQSHHDIDYGLSKVVGRDEETSEWRKRNSQGNSNQQLKASAVHNYSSGLDLRRPRALISAYGIDEREKK